MAGEGGGSKVKGGLIAVTSLKPGILHLSIQRSVFYQPVYVPTQSNNQLVGLQVHFIILLSNTPPG